MRAHQHSQRRNIPSDTYARARLHVRARAFIQLHVTESASDPAARNLTDTIDGTGEEREEDSSEAQTDGAVPRESEDESLELMRTRSSSLPRMRSSSLPEVGHHLHTHVRLNV